jgi:hypothetical protein
MFIRANFKELERANFLDRLEQKIVYDTGNT